jgi:peptidoglycan/xylan/chitin deacetylase (PgdA/CDA1 family)
MSKRDALASLLHRSGAVDRLLELRAHVNVPWLSILTYHRFPRATGEETFDDGVIDTTPDELDEHLRHVRRHFTLVGVDELCEFAAGGSLPRNPLALTFDDGYLDNYEVALPILQRHGCKAIFFVATRFTGERRLFWWDRLAYLVKQSQRSCIELSYPERFRVELGDRNRAVFQLLRFVKRCSSVDLERLLNELSVAAGVPWCRDREREYAEQLLMTWDHLRALRRAGMDVESHTRSHRILQTLSDAELAEELIGSANDLERELGARPRALAYPVGRPLAKGSPIRDAMSRAGYRVGLTNGTGSTPAWGRRDPFGIRRLTVARQLPTSVLLSMLALPPLAPNHSLQ